jgi:hypothetical protein
MAPAAFRIQYGIDAPDVSRGARFAAVRVAVRDPAATAAALKSGAIDTQLRMGRIVIGPNMAMGATLVFEPT